MLAEDRKVVEAVDKWVREHACGECPDEDTEDESTPSCAAARAAHAFVSELEGWNTRHGRVKG